jgi:hypothetical protein
MASSGGLILPLVITFLIYFLFFDKWNRRKYKDAIEAASWSIPIMFLPDQNTHETIFRTYAIDNGYYLYTGPSGDSPPDSLSNLRSSNDKQVFKKNLLAVASAKGLDKYDIYDANDNKLTLTIDMTNPTLTGVSGEVFLKSTMKDKEGKLIATFTVYVKNGKVSDYFDYDKNILIKGCGFKWELRGYIFKSDWRDVKDWILNKFKD